MKLLQPPPVEKQLCNCKADLVYRATVNDEDGKVIIYTGLTCNEFKTRGAHKHSINNLELN